MKAEFWLTEFYETWYVHLDLISGSHAMRYDIG